MSGGLDSVGRGTCYAAVARAPLHRALQLADDALQEGARNLRRFSRTQGHDATQLRYLHASVKHLLNTRPEMAFESRLDMTAFRATKEAIENQDNDLAGILAALQALEHYTKETEWRALLEDMKAAGKEGHDAMAQPLAVVTGVLGTSSKTLPASVEFFEEHPEVLDPTSYSDSFKSGRRGFKMIVALLKAATDVGLANDAGHLQVTAAGRPKLLPDGPYKRVQQAIAKWVKLTLGADIFKDHEAASVQGLQAVRKALDLPSVLWCAALADTINAWRAIRNLAKASDKQKPQAWLALTSSTASLGRSLAALTELRLKRAATEKTGDLMKAVLLDQEVQYQATLKKAAVKAARFRLLRNVTGAVGSGIDVFLSTKKACQEYEVDDFNAAVATGISAVGSLVSTVGYVTAIWNPAIGVVLLAAGEVLMLVGTIAYAFCKNSELEAWLEHSLWGKSRNSAACGSTKWSRGPLSKYHHDLSKQIIAFDEIMFPVEAKWSADPTESIVFGQDDLCYLEVHCPVLSTDSVLTLGVSGETRPGVWEVVRPFGPVQVSQGGGEGRIVVRAAGYRRLVANCKIDIYGDRSHMLPHDTYKSAAISPTLAVRYEPPMLM